MTAPGLSIEDQGKLVTRCLMSKEYRSACAMNLVEVSLILQPCYLYEPHSISESAGTLFILCEIDVEWIGGVFGYVEACFVGLCAIRPLCVSLSDELGTRSNIVEQEAGCVPHALIVFPES